MSFLNISNFLHHPLHPWSTLFLRWTFYHILCFIADQCLQLWNIFAGTPSQMVQLLSFSHCFRSNFYHSRFALFYDSVTLSFLKYATEGDFQSPSAQISGPAENLSSWCTYQRVVASNEHAGYSYCIVAVFHDPAPFLFKTLLSLPVSWSRFLQSVEIHHLLRVHEQQTLSTAWCVQSFHQKYPNITDPKCIKISSFPTSKKPSSSCQRQWVHEFWNHFVAPRLKWQTTFIPVLLCQLVNVMNTVFEPNPFSCPRLLNIYSFVISSSCFFFWMFWTPRSSLQSLHNAVLPVLYSSYNFSPCTFKPLTSQLRWILNASCFFIIL